MKIGKHNYFESLVIVFSGEKQIYTTYCNDFPENIARLEIIRIYSVDSIIYIDVKED